MSGQNLIKAQVLPFREVFTTDRQLMISGYS